MKPKQIFILSFVLGFAAIIAQTLILRAFQTVFYGNELSYAVLLASWLVWVAAGSFLTTVFVGAGFKPAREEGGAQTLPYVCFAALALGIPVVLFGIRYIRPLLDVGAGQMIGIVPMIASSLIVTAPVGFLVGSIFVLLCFVAADDQQDPGSVYFWESLGSAIGGLVFAFVLLKLFSMTVVAWGLAVIITATLLWEKGDSHLFIVKKVAVLFLLILLLAFLGLDAVFDLDFLSQQKQYPFAQLIAAEDSPYANIAVVKREEEYSVYQNGLLSFTADDLLSAEEAAHFPMLAHPHPSRVLLIGNGLGGELKELLEYQNASIDFVEIDAQLIAMAKEYLPEEETGVLNDSRITVHLMDARRFVRTIDRQYDVVIVNVGDPYTAGLNRYYTLEFLEELDRVLDVGGIASFRVSSSENFLNDENRTFLRSLYSTMTKVFPEVRSIPGDTHTFLVSNLKDQISLDASYFSGRLLGEGLTNTFVSEHTLPFRLSPQRIAEVEKILTAQPGLINTDLLPRAYFFQTILWSTHFDFGLKRVMEKVSAIPAWAVFVLCVFAVGWLCLLQTRAERMRCVNIAVAFSGFSEIIFEIVVILAFQSLYGTAYDKIALILASFMLGLVVGSRWAICVASTVSPQQCLKCFRWIQLGVAVYPLLLPLLFIVFRDVRVMQQYSAFFAVVFACLPFIAGLLGGMQYPLAAKLLGKGSAGGHADAAGKLYAQDALGAAAGAIVTATILIPLYGIVAVCALCAAVNGMVFLFLMKR